MKLKEHTLIILFLFLMLFVCIGSVSALENQTDEISENEVISVSESPEILTANEGTYTDLAAKIDDAIANNDSVLYLPYDFMYNDEIDHEYNQYIFPDHTYYGILINKTLTINGNNHAISGSNVARIFTINATDGIVTFNNITFKDSIGAVRTDTDLSINDCNFINNTKENVWTDWSAIQSSGGKLTITNSTFVNNTSIKGGAIFVSGAESTTITGSVFTKNTAVGYGETVGTGGAIYANKGHKLNIHNCIFTDNTAIGNTDPSFAGAVHALCDNTVITNSIFNNNSADCGGALDFARSAVLSNSNFTSNFASDKGDDISNNDMLTIQSCNFYNPASENSAIYNSRDSELSLSNNNISSTKAGIYNELGKITSTTNVTVLENKTVKTEYGQTVTLNATYTDGNGNLIYDSSFYFTVEGVADPIPATYADGLYTAEYKADKVEEKVISAKLDYDVTTYNGLLDIGPSNDTTFVFVQNLTKYYNGSEKFTVTVTDGKGQLTPNKTVKITINGVTYSRTTDENGTTKLNINLNSGEYPVIVVVDDIVVNSSVFIESTIDSSDVDRIFGDIENYYYSTTFFDANGNRLEYAPVLFNINGVIYNNITDEEGIYILYFNLLPGDYIVTATNTVTGEMKSNSIKIISIIESSDLTKYYMNDSQFVVRVLNKDGSYGWAGNEVKFNINGVSYTRLTNETGHAKLNINLAQGNYTITTYYNNCSEENEITVLPILSADDLVMKYKDGSQFKTKLVDGQGKAYAGQSVQFNVNGVLYNRTTGSDGIAKLNINLMPGEYIITSSYNGANVANKITIKS